MCLGVPARIISVEGEMATVSVGGVEYSASLRLLPDAAVNDFVIIHAGFAIEKVDPEEALETIRLIHEIENGSSENKG
ncbi:MAG: HypC/HybG/HupF family hydrogenase formation chaperone [Bacteroidetes bacterium]|nr:HypC/HybG/HupF family hydrogenase formation chaperone [Bacteroidota bacterium]